MLDGLLDAVEAIGIGDDELLRLDHAKQKLEFEETQPNEGEQSFEVFLPAMSSRVGEGGHNADSDNDDL